MPDVALVDVGVEKVATAHVGAAHEARPDGALDRAADGVAVVGHVDLGVGDDVGVRVRTHRRALVSVDSRALALGMHGAGPVLDVLGVLARLPALRSRRGGHGERGDGDQESRHMSLQMPRAGFGAALEGCSDSL